MPLESLPWVAAIILFAYCIRGITGFGSGLIAVPLLAHLLPLQLVVPFVLMLDFSASATLGGRFRAHIQWKEIGPLLPAAAAGILLGVGLLLRLPRSSLLTALGAFVLVFGLRNLIKFHGNRPISRLWALPAGFAAGTIGAMFGTGGPPYIIYLSHRLQDKSAMRATFSGLFILDGGFRLLAFLAAGLLLQAGMGRLLLLGFPLMALGLFLGHRVHGAMSSRHMLRLIGLLLTLTGASLLWSAWR